ncbi:MAG: enolase C-terminal domain-like protein [Verrucomicrobiota bacterium]
MKEVIERFDLYRLSFPLVRPYALSFTTVESLDVLWVRAELESGSVGWGESAPLPGYNEGAIGVVWDFGCKLAKAWVGKSASRALELAACEKGDRFLTTAVETAVEEAAKIIPCQSGVIPIVGLIQGEEAEDLGEEIDRRRKQGFVRYKAKLGGRDVGTDIKRVVAIQCALEAGEMVRFDANQGLDMEAARRLLEECDPAKVEFFEQPLPTTSLEEMGILADEFPITLLLDESVTGRDIIRGIGEMGKRFAIKLKWMKQSGWNGLKDSTQIAESFGMSVVLGNGVATYLNNWHECQFWASMLKNFNLSGEMNGFLKLDRIPADCGLIFESGAIKLSSVRELVVPERHLLDAEHFSV